MAPLVAEAIEAKAPRTSEAKTTEAGVPRTTEAMVVEAGAPGTTEAGAMEADVSTAKLAAQEVEMKAAEASVPPLVQGLPPLRESARGVEVRSISSDDTSRGKEGVDVEAASTVEQPAPTSGEGSSALVRVQPEPHGWDHSRVLWRSQDDPEGEPLFALEDVAEGGCWDTFEQYRQLAERSLRTALSVVANDLPEVAQSVEVEDLCLHSADMKATAAAAQEQVAPLAAWVKELEEELTRVADDWDAFRSRAREAMAFVKALAGQLGTEQELEEVASRAAEASQVEVQCLREKAEASRVEAEHWEAKAEGLEKEVSRVVEASIAVQAVLEAEIGEHTMLRSATRTACEALEVEGV
ncbi:uncharacterized protein [Miscanthus floridulus]|uniref:uncharacterized protein n=1 Tax=Miscanthus floridulus TaxID=154761 RepID=UPI00345A4502